MNNLSETMEAQGLPYQLINDMSDIYAWTIDFFRLQKGDRFKIVYKQRYIEDSIYAGIESIDAAYFEHKGEPLYAFKFTTDSIKQIEDYFDENINGIRQINKKNTRWSKLETMTYYLHEHK